MAIKICSLISVFSLLLSISLFSQELLLPPDSLKASQQCDEILLEWKVPQQSTYEIVGYNVYLQDSLLSFTADTNYQTQMQGNGFVFFNVTTLYDAGESLPASVEVELVIYAPATNLTYDKYQCEFSWSPPEGNYPTLSNWEDKTLQWCDNENYTEIGTGGEVEFEVAVIWGPDQLSQYNDGELFLTKIDFYPAEAQASYIVRVWESNNPDAPDEVIYSQPVTDFTINQWNSIMLSDSILIEIDKYLWVGYEINTPTGYPAGVDDGPAINGYGNMMNFGGWQTSLEINPELDYNWNIKGGFLYITGISLYYDIYGYWECFTPWDHWLKLNEYPIYDTTFFYACIFPSDEWWVDTCFVQVRYCNVPVNSDTAVCEICRVSNSDPVENEKVISFSVSNGLGNWIIHSDDPLLKLVVYDLTGKVMYIKNDESNDLIINYRAYAPGLYLIEGITAKEKYVRKIIR